MSSLPDKPKSRQQRWQEKQYQLKRCAVCGDNVKNNMRLCPTHREAAKERLRVRRGAVKRYTTMDQWLTVDWARPIGEIAAEFGVMPATARWRKRTLKDL